MEAELKKLRIDRSAERSDNTRPSTRRLGLAVLAAALLGGSGYVLYARFNLAPELEVVRLRAPESSTEIQDPSILDATGYIIAAHKIEVASKVVGRVAWIGIEKGDKVRRGQVLVRLEDEEFRARVLEAQGQLESFRARLAELENGSRPEEIARAASELEQARAELSNAQVTLERARALTDGGVLARQTLDDIRTRHSVQAARVASVENTYELVRLGPRPEQIEALRAQVRQAEGVLAFAQTQLENTLIRAPVWGTVLERTVEKGEFVTTGFVGDRGAKGYVASLADLNDLEVELDISQNDFAKLAPRQPALITTDAYPDRRCKGYLSEISPEANRQKATVQVKVKIVDTDEHLRPEMNASVAFITRDDPDAQAKPKPRIAVPASAVRGGTVFIMVNGKAVRRAVQLAGTSREGMKITAGLAGGEDLIVNPPENLKDGDKVKIKEVPYE